MKNEYLHNFACWAAARAVQNPNLKGTDTKTIKNAIEKLDLYSYVDNPQKLSDYPKVHEELVDKLLEFLSWDNESYYGVAAKIIAIYFKVSIILPSKAPHKIINKIYPPMDANNIHRLKGFKKSTWTKMGKTEFSNIIKGLNDYILQNKMTYIEFESKNPLNR
jgi:hypothetical protein